MSVRTLAGGKVLTAQIELLNGGSMKAGTRELIVRINESVSEKIAKEPTVKLISGAFKVPYSAAIRGLVRVEKSKDNKNNTIERTIHVGRPSKFIEVFTNEERDYLRCHEAPWNDLQNLQEKYAKGVPLSELDGLRDAFKKAYNATFEISGKLSGWRANRRNLISKFRPQKGKGALKFKSSDVQELLSWIADATKEKDLSNEYWEKFSIMNPHHLFKNFEDDRVFTKYLIPSSLAMGNLSDLRHSIDDGEYDEILKWTEWIPRGISLSHLFPAGESDESDSSTDIKHSKS